MKPLPENAKNYIKHIRVAPGRGDFEVWLTAQREDAVTSAIYSPDPNARAIAAGRAQAWSEIYKVLVQTK